MAQLNPESARGQNCNSTTEHTRGFAGRSNWIDLRKGVEEVCTGAEPESVSGNCDLGSTGHWPVPSGDSPDGMGRASPANEDGLMPRAAWLVSVGGSPTGTGESPVLRIFQTRPQFIPLLGQETVRRPDSPGNSVPTRRPAGRLPQR